VTNSGENRAGDATLNHHSLLAELESRQDELLRMLTELEERTKQALAQLNPVAAPAPAIEPRKVA
jgi:hypothetical protein